ncbi:MAG: phage tail protein [Oscillospiraceae bacterium]
MDNSRLFITLNRASEWSRGLLSGLKLQGNSVVSDGGGSSFAAMVTGSVDSTEHNFCWKDLLVDLEIPESMVLRIYAYTADSTICSLDNAPVELDSYLSASAIPAEEKLRRLEPLFRLIGTGTTDCPVNMRGRYIWIKLEFVAPEERSIRINKLRLLLRRESMMDYLPEIYRAEDGENGFMSRYISIFDSIFFDMDDRISALDRGFDYRSAEGAMLKYLADWLEIEDTAYLSDEELRKRISASPEEYRAIGTKRGLSEWIESEYGVKPNIIEYFSVRKMVYEGKDRECYRRLFGTNPYSFFILLPATVFTNTHEANIFMEKLRRRVPANTQPQVVLTRQSVILENHTYLGVNSVISGYSEAGADTGNRISHDLILGGNNNE